MNIQKNISLKRYNSWLVGGNAEFFGQPANVEELKEQVAWAQSQNLKIHILGTGSNVLISDQGLPGLCLQLSKLTGIETIESGADVLFHCWAGTGKSELLKIFLKYKLQAALFIAGIPGQIGGGIAMNAGIAEQISPREFVEIVDWIEVLKIPSLKIERFAQKDLQWDYRHCTGWQPGIITRVGLKLLNQPTPDILDKVRAANLLRAQRQPLELPSCGSVFVNPSGDKAGRLVEASGLKGFRIGGAQVSEKHANFIVNLGSATAKDLEDVIFHVQKTVEQKFSVKLRTEVVWLP
jgi:UDP-N-acetylmuramate dehydrogenase